MARQVFEELNYQKNRGILLVLSGPSGAGKDTLLNELLGKHPNSIKIVTTTTRTPRENEQNGIHHHFVSHDEFENLIGSGELFEWVEFRGELYGTTERALKEALDQNKDVLWRIDMKGVKNIKNKVQKITNRAVFVFLTAPTMEELEQRIVKDEKDPSTRWKPNIVTWELAQYADCDYLVVNNDNYLEDAVKKVLSIMEAKRYQIIDED